MKHANLAPTGARIALLPLLLLLAGCFGGGTSSVPVLPERTAPQAPDQGQAAEATAQQRNTLHTSMPALTNLTSGDEFEFVLAGSFNGELFQASARVLYDSKVVQVLGAERGALIPEDAVYLARTDLAPGELAIDAEESAGCDSVVPFAYTQLPGSRAEPGRSGELLRLRFRLTGRPTPGQPAVRLLNKQDYLQLRDSAGRRLSFDLETAEEARR